MQKEKQIEILQANEILKLNAVIEGLTVKCKSLETNNIEMTKLHL